MAAEIDRRLPVKPKFSREQVLRLNENKSFSHDEAIRDFGYSPRPLRDGLVDEVRLYRNS